MNPWNTPNDKTPYKHDWFEQEYWNYQTPPEGATGMKGCRWRCSACGLETSYDPGATHFANCLVPCPPYSEHTYYWENIKIETTSC